MLKQRVLDDVKTAMKAGDKPRLATLRLISAAIKQREVDERIELDDTQMLAVLEKMVKQRRESISQYEKAGRTDLADQEQFELVEAGEPVTAERLNSMYRELLEIYYGPEYSIDADDSIELHPAGLMNLKITARQEDNLNRVNIRITWQSEDKASGNKSIKVKCR